MLVEAQNSAVAILPSDIEKALLSMPQCPAPVVHHFGPGIYIREVTLPEGALAVGHAQRYEHLNVMLTGKVAMIDGESVKVLTAPLIFVAKPGRKFGYVMEKTTWLNVYSTDETDIDTLESMLFDKSDAWIAADVQRWNDERAMRQCDRDDFDLVLAEFGFTEEQAIAQSENESDQTEMPPGFATVTVRKSPIAGKGVFLSSPVSNGSVIAPGTVLGKRTPVGRYVNHSITPNAEFVQADGGDYYLVALRDIDGCIGGGSGEEITTDYRKTLELRGMRRIA
jgi:hypothetical protein